MGLRPADITEIYIIYTVIPYADCQSEMEIPVYFWTAAISTGRTQQTA